MNEALQTLAEEYWEWKLKVGPTTALIRGDHRFDDQWEDASRSAEDEMIDALRAFVARAEAVETSTLSADEQITQDVLVFDAGHRAAMLEMRSAHFGANHAIGPQATLPTSITQFPLVEPEHAQAMVPKYRELGRYIRQLADRLLNGVAAGQTPHAFTVAKTIEQLDKLLATPLDSDPFLNLREPASFDADQTAAWKQQIQDTVADHVRPAWEHYRDTLRDEVAPNARPDDQAGMTHMPGGDELYRRAVAFHTSTDLTADEIHQIGLDQIERLGDEYRELGKSELGTGDLDEILTRLRDDPELRFASGADVVAKSEVALENASKAMHDWFGRLPQAPCLVGEVATGPLAFYSTPAADGSRPGMFYVNTEDPSSWQTFFVESMAFHEGIPGHHLQLAISSELDGIPEFRKKAMVTAYAEGWGLYAERLADEMGLYSTPFDRFGIFVADSMRACRLVVDTGMHAKGWSRDQGIEFMLANSPMTRHAVEAEIDRYLGMPGQALSYMVGRLEILKYRRKAEDALGDRFDIKDFHDVVIGSGLVPLATLERMIDAWVTVQS